MDRESLQLYARPTFSEGFARIFDLTGWLNQYRYSDSEEEADYFALLSDWMNVGEDIYQAVTIFKEDIIKEN